jgi:hypothetical protein
MSIINNIYYLIKPFELSEMSEIKSHVSLLTPIFLKVT